MSTKLTLSLKKETIEKAKEYAKTHNISLSFIIENYLRKLIADYKFDTQKKGSIVDELSGIINLDTEVDYKDLHSAYLIEKHK